MTVLTRLSGSDYPLKITASEFLALADAGLFQHYGRTELIEGEVWTMNAVHRWHSRVQTQFGITIAEALKASNIDLVVSSAGSVLLSDDSVPEPDLCVGEDEPLTPEPISLAAMKIAVELSDTTREVDLGRKAMLYARHGVPEYWVADREKRVLVRHALPSAQGYRAIDDIDFGEPFASATIPELIVQTRCLIG